MKRYNKWKYIKTIKDIRFSIIEIKRRNNNKKIKKVNNTSNYLIK